MPAIEIGEKDSILRKLKLDADAGLPFGQMPRGAQVRPALLCSLPLIPPPEGKFGTVRWQPKPHLVSHPSVSIAITGRNASAIPLSTP